MTHVVPPLFECVILSFVLLKHGISTYESRGIDVIVTDRFWGFTVAIINESANEAASNPCSVESTPISKMENGSSINDVLAIPGFNSSCWITVSILANILVSFLISSNPNCSENNEP